MAGESLNGVTPNNGVNFGEAAADGVSAGLSGFAGSIGSINDYDVVDTGQPFQYDENSVSRRDRGRMKSRVDKLNAEWQARQDERRAAIETQRNTAHDFRLQAEEQSSISQDLTSRFNAAMRMVSKDTDNNAKIEEASQRIFATADQDDALKDQMIQNWGR